MYGTDSLMSFSVSGHYIHCVYTSTDLITYLLTPWSRVLLEKLTFLSLSRNSPHFMEPEGSLPYLREPATCPYCVYANNITFSSVCFSITFAYCVMAYQIQ